MSCEQHHHHHVVLLAQISLTLSRHFSHTFIVSGRSSRLHPVSSHSCWMYVRVGHPAFAWPYVGVHRNTSLMSSSPVSCMSGSSNLDNFHDGRQVAVLLVPCGVLPPGLVQYSLAAFLCNYHLRNFIIQKTLWIKKSSICILIMIKRLETVFFKNLVWLSEILDYAIVFIPQVTWISIFIFKDFIFLSHYNVLLFLNGLFSAV